ncbi:MAG: hypothetical protein M3Y81_28215 [Chloroflexota bacterium]|nr:hypothetical protein [Chloroflexota bacterium]
MILHVGERVYWGAPEVIYLEGTISKLDEATQAALVHIERATPNSAHLVGSDITFFADGLRPLTGASPPDTTDKRSLVRQALPEMDDNEKVRRAASAAIHQQYGYTLPPEQEQVLIEQVYQSISADASMRQRIIASMDAILRRGFMEGS